MLHNIIPIVMILKISILDFILFIKNGNNWLNSGEITATIRIAFMIKAILYDIMLFFALSVGALKNVNCSKATTDIQISIPPGTTVATLLLINNAENQYKLEKML